MSAHPWWSRRPAVVARCLLAGLLLAASVPPWGWWPLAFVGVALWDRLLADQRARRRAARSWLVAAAWLFPSTLWMWDLTPPGYLVAQTVYAGYFALAGVLVPRSRPAGWVALPGAIMLAEIARWTFPFGGVPLSSLAMSQAAAPLGQLARTTTAIGVSGAVAVGGVALSAAFDRRWRAAMIAALVVLVPLALSLVAPDGHDTVPLTYAIVQGGGPQRTRASDTDPAEVFARHLEATGQVDTPVQLVLWPENVVDVNQPFADTDEAATLSELARRLDTTLVVGVTEDVGEDRFTNAAVTILPDGTIGERYDKVRRVPFGEYVPLRSLIEQLAGSGSGLPKRDALAGTDPAVVHTPAGTLGVAISWEIFFTNRARDAALHGGEVLLNPTNGSSYWLTQVQSQQIASSRLRAIETGRWVLQAAPTGFSAVVNPDGDVLARSGTSERWVHQGTVWRRQGDTIATVVGPTPWVVLAFAAVVVGALIDRRRSGDDEEEELTPA